MEEQYLNLLYKVRHSGIDSDDRTGTGTVSLFHNTIRCDLAKGFPLLTTKRMFLKGIIHELLWMVSGSTNTKYLKDNKINIWSSWGDDNGNLGPVYGHALRNFGGKHKNRPQPKPDYTTHHQSVPSDGRLQYRSNSFGDFVVDKVDGQYSSISFLNTGYFTKVRNDKVKSGAVRDCLAISVCGVGFLGKFFSHRTEEVDYFITKWESMLHRCYVNTHKYYKDYGERGVYVCDRWLNFMNFYQDAKQIEGWDENNKSILQLDKDIKGDSFCYSLSTCLWATPKENSVARFLEKYNKGVDQLQDTIGNIKSNPYSRRHVMTLWNPTDLPHQALACCHGTAIQFYIREGKLSCSMIQRSADVLLGVPFDIALYALLTQMIAQVCNLKLGELVITFGDTHIYKNHFEQVEEQLSRTSFDLPKMSLHPDIKDINDFKYEHFALSEYKCHPSIKAKVAV